MSNAARSRFAPSRLRLAHSYVVFFALSGSLQILDLHQTHGTQKPSPLFSAIGKLARTFRGILAAGVWCR